MRAPTDISARWSWWERAVSGEPVECQEMEPQCGFYKVRKFRHAEYPKRDAPWLPARVWLEPGEIDAETGELMSDEKWRAEIDGKRANIWKVWTWLAQYPISEAEFQWLTALSPLTMKRLPKQ